MVYPDKYGVWNKTAQKAMEALGLWPQTDRGADFAERYEAVNRVLVEVAEELAIDLWTLDMLWWRVCPHMVRGARDGETIPSGYRTVPVAPGPEGIDEGDVTSVQPIETEESIVAAEGASAVFGLERHLHEFLVDNWGVTELGKDWDLYEEDGEIVGSRYDTGEIGEIDLLARHKSENRWLVIELKRSQTSDATVGQILRYMTWVRRRLAADAGNVEGLVICRQPDDKLRYALDGQPSIRCMTYQVSFSLVAAPAS